MIKLSRKSRSMLSLGLNSLALCFSVSAFCTSYWCEGTHKVVKPPCLSAVKKGNCVPVNSNDTMDGNVTMDPHVVQYIWETGEDKFSFRYFHTGFWFSCEEHHGAEKCRSFIELPPESEKGLLGMVAHMMYMTVFQVAVNLGPKDWRPQTWYYGWSFGMAWLSFTLCMSASVLTLNTYTKTILEFKYRQRIFEKHTASMGSLRGSDPPALAPDIERYLWDKYIFSVSDSLDFSPSPPGPMAPCVGRKAYTGGYAGLAGGYSGDAGDEDDGEPC
nr:PREDICTED: germ cell-specific gene 1-like protein isoform X2 [Anolis carolinensis]|eukprot:XP_008115423.1 PREDICTED: germ cell-specific gene 1-like protein isoform X2 [Anolis carolinensis]